MIFEEIAIPLITFAVFFAFGFVAKKLVLKAFTEWTKVTQTKVDDAILDTLKFPAVLWWLMLSIFFALKVSHLPDDIISFFNKLILVISVSSFTVATADISGKLIKLYSKNKESSLAITSLTYNVTKIAIFTCGGLILLSSLGISITPILATLGVGGLSVALALQDTFSNLFAGLQITVTKHIRVGDYIKLEPEVQGYVTDINWRFTKIRMLDNTMVIVPNAKLTQAIVANYCLPDKELSVAIEVGVHYNSNLEKVEKVTSEVAREVMQSVDGGIASFEPFIRYHSFGESSINLSVILRVREFVDQYHIKHEFIKKLHRRYQKEGIMLPYPIRAINYAQEKER